MRKLRRLRQQRPNKKQKSDGNKLRHRPSSARQKKERKDKGKKRWRKRGTAKLKKQSAARQSKHYKPDKLNKNRTRVTVGGDRIYCDYDISAPTCDIPTIKLLWNSVLLTPGARYFTIDISNFYLGFPLDKPEYMRMPMKLIPIEIVENMD